MRADQAVTIGVATPSGRPVESIALWTRSNWSPFWRSQATWRTPSGVRAEATSSVLEAEISVTWSTLPGNRAAGGDPGEADRDNREPAYRAPEAPDTTHCSVRRPADRGWRSYASTLRGARRQPSTGRTALPAPGIWAWK